MPQCLIVLQALCEEVKRDINQKDAPWYYGGQPPNGDGILVAHEVERAQMWHSAKRAAPMVEQLNRRFAGRMLAASAEVWRVKQMEDEADAAARAALAKRLPIKAGDIQ